MPSSHRLSGLLKKIKAGQAFLVTDMSNVRYLTGFTGSSASVLAAKSGAFFITDFRYREQAGLDVAGLDGSLRIVIENRDMPRAVGKILKKLAVGTLVVESTLPYGLFRRLSRHASDIEASDGTVEKMRQVKDPLELDAIREAVRRAEAAFGDVQPFIKAGASEREIALRLEERVRRMGSRRVPFDIIVSSGPNSAMPHAGVTDRRLGPGDLVIIDWGAEAGGYFSDMTRTMIVRGGRGQGEKRRIYSLVLSANERAMAMVLPGAGTREVDAAARETIKAGGYGECFGHGLGHGVGLDVHELPRLSRARDVPIKSGMVFTIEPGVYVPGLGGVRIEDMVCVGNRGAEVLTSLSRKLRVI